MVLKILSSILKRWFTCLVWKMDRAKILGNHLNSWKNILIKINDMTILFSISMEQHYWLALIFISYISKRQW
jgi:hypothetical protein